MGSVMVEGGAACLIAGMRLRMLANHLSAVACGLGAWAFATHDASGKSAQSVVSILDTGGNPCQRKHLKALLQDDDDEDSKKAEKLKDKRKKPKPVEQQG